MLLLHNICDALLQLKKAVGELNTAVEQKDEIAQRCHELDLQVGSLQSAINTCQVDMLSVGLLAV